MKTFDSITLVNGKVLKLFGGQKHRNNNTIRYFCEHAAFFMSIKTLSLTTADCS